MTDEERDQRLAAIRQREAAAAPGPWDLWLGELDPFKGGSVPVHLGRENTGGWGLYRNPGACEETEDELIADDAEPFSIADCAFITGAREDIPFLLAEIERLKRGDLSDVEWRTLLCRSDREMFHFLEKKISEVRAKFVGSAKPETAEEYAFFRSLYAGQVEPCCDCGDDYPRTDLIIDGEIYCPKHREMK